MHGLTVARINFEFTHRIDPDRRRRKTKIELMLIRRTIDLKRLLAARGGADRIIQIYLKNPGLILGGSPTSIGDEIGLSLAERRRHRTWSFWPCDVSKQACRRLTKLERNLRKKLRAREKRRAAGIRPLSESLSQTKPWLAEGISRTTWYARRKRSSDNHVPHPIVDRGAANDCPSSENEEENREDHAGNGRGGSDSSAGIDLSRWRCRRVGLPLGEIEGRIPRRGPCRVESGLNRSHSRSELIEEGQPMAPELPKTEPKPNHFRGETMEQLRPDDLKDAISEQKFFCGNPLPITERARGMWSTILPALGIDPKFLTAKNGPCPICGGKDRFRYTDLDGKGTWWCNGCDDNNGRNGLGLALKFTGLPYEELTKQISAIIGGAPPPQIRRDKPRSPNRGALNELWKHARPIEPDDPVDRYLTGRGITIRDYPRCLRFVRQAKHADGTVHPAMLAAVSDTDGKPATIHKTYLTFDGQKAAVDRVRLFCPGPRPEGGAVRLATHGADLGIAEGIETALAASQLHGVPVWAALDAGGLERFIPPPEVTRLLIFGDHDANFAGHKAAYCLAMRAILVLKIKVEVKIPDRAGTDWNDVLRGVQP